MVPYDVQLVGGIALHQGKIAEMKTGEGKTLVSVAPIFLNALAGRGVHVVTVNPYLAQRDAEWMQPVFDFHGLRVDVIDKYEASGADRRAAYLADVTYGTNNEFGFDYLRDNSFVFDADQLSQRQHHFAIVDEVDSVLIDEARTPLIISGPVPTDSQQQRFEELRPVIDSLVYQQQKLVAGFVAEAEREIKARDALQGKGREAKKHEEAAGLALLRAHRGFPRNKRLQKFLQEPGMGTLLQKTEFYYLQDSGKEMPFVDEALYFALDERNHSLEMTDMGRDYAAARPAPTPTCSSCRTSGPRPPTSNAPRRTPSPRAPTRSPPPSSTRTTAARSTPSTASAPRCCTPSSSCCAPTRSSRRTWSTSCRRTR